MKKVSLKINYQQMVGLLQWLERFLHCGSMVSHGYKEMCFRAVLETIRLNKVLPKTHYKFPGFTRITLQAHEALALAEAISCYSPDNFTYIDAWLSAQLMLIDQKFT